MSQPEMDLRKLVDSLSKSSSEYAEKATKLSNFLDRVESFLQSLPGKIGVSASSGSLEISFDRIGQAWRLHCPTERGFTLLSECPIEVKAKAVSLLPELLSELISKNSSRVQMIDEALDLLQTSPLLKDLYTKEEA